MISVIKAGFSEGYLIRMTTTDIRVVEQPPSADEFASLRNLIGWRNPSLSVIQQSLDSSLFWVSLYRNNELIGCGRIVGDGAMYFYVQDIIVHPKYQNCGLGSIIMTSINQYIEKTCQPGATVGLLAAKGKEAFYEKHGFVGRDGNTLGLGMCRFI